MDWMNEGKKGRPYGFPGSSIKIHYGISGLITGLRDGEVAGKMLDALMIKLTAILALQGREGGQKA